jgi:hypothetical protein
MLCTDTEVGEEEEEEEEEEVIQEEEEEDKEDVGPDERDCSTGIMRSEVPSRGIGLVKIVDPSTLSKIALILVIAASMLATSLSETLSTSSSVVPVINPSLGCRIS